MMRRLVVAIALMLAVATGVTLFPRPASASSSDLVYIIPAAVGGVAVIALVIAIVVTEHKAEPELDFADHQLPVVAPSGGIHLAPKCRPTAEGLPLFCW